MIDKNILSQLTPSRMPIRTMPGESDDSAENSMGEDLRKDEISSGEVTRYAPLTRLPMTMKSVIKGKPNEDMKNTVGNIDLESPFIGSFRPLDKEPRTKERLLEKARLSCQYIISLTALVRARTKFIQMLIEALIGSYAAYAKVACQRAEEHQHSCSQKINDLLHVIQPIQGDAAEKETRDLIDLKVELSTVVGDFSSIGQNILKELSVIRKKFEEDKTFDSSVERMYWLQQNFCSSFSKSFRNVIEGNRDFSELGTEKGNLWLNEFYAFQLFKNLLRHYTKEYISKFVIYTNKLETVEAKINNIISKVNTVYADWKENARISHFKDEPRQIYSHELQQNDLFSMVPAKFVAIITKVIRQSKRESESITTTRDKLNKFFVSYKVLPKVNNNLVEYFVKCLVLDRGTTRSCYLVIDVSSVLSSCTAPS